MENTGKIWRVTWIGFLCLIVVGLFFGKGTSKISSMEQLASLIGVQEDYEILQSIELYDEPKLSHKNEGRRIFADLIIIAKDSNTLDQRTVAMLQSIDWAYRNYEFDAIRVRLVNADARISPYMLDSYGEFWFSRDMKGCCASGDSPPNGTFENGQWQGEVSDYGPSEIERKIFREWNNKHKKYLDPNGFVNEKKLKMEVSTSLGIKPADVSSAFSRRSLETIENTYKIVPR
ncbi:MAG: hypothetical protein WD185_01105 [Sneathiella sp.]